MSNGEPDVGAAFQKHTNEILSRLQEVNTRLSEQMTGQAKVLKEGMSAVQNQIKEQTMALGEMEIIKYIAEMEAILELIKLEEGYAASEKDEDSADMIEMEEYFTGRKEEIDRARNSQVGDLTKPICLVMEQELENTLEERMCKLVPLLRECFEVTNETVQTREKVMKTVIEKSQSAVEAFIRQRREVRSAVAGLQVDPSRIPDVDEEGVAIAIPLYLVEIEDRSGSSTFEVIGPSLAGNSEQNPAGIRLQPIQGFENVVRAFGARVSDLQQLFRGGVRERTGTLAEALPDGSRPGGLAGLAWASMRKHLAKRDVTYRVEGRAEDSMAHEYRRQAPGSAAVSNEKPGSPATSARANGEGARYYAPAETQSIPTSTGSPAPRPEIVPVPADKEQTPSPHASRQSSPSHVAVLKHGNSQEGELNEEDAIEVLHAAIDLIEIHQYEEAYQILDDLVREGRSNPTVELYHRLCDQEIKKGGATDE